VEAVAEVRRVSGMFDVLADSAGIYPLWLEMIERYQVLGKRAHDTRIAAAMAVAQIPAILTFNDRDFRRYSGIEILDPVGVTAEQK
jgi:predicted nucleic acid-binding protein